MTFPVPFDRMCPCPNPAGVFISAPRVTPKHGSRLAGKEPPSQTLRGNPLSICYWLAVGPLLNRRTNPPSNPR